MQHLTIHLCLHQAVHRHLSSAHSLFKLTCHPAHSFHTGELDKDVWIRGGRRKKTFNWYKIVICRFSQGKNDLCWRSQHFKCFTCTRLQKDLHNGIFRRVWGLCHADVLVALWIMSRRSDGKSTGYSIRLMCALKLWKLPFQWRV